MKRLFVSLLIAALLSFSISAQATLPPVKNFAKATVSVGYNSAATSIVLLSGHGAKLPSTFPFPMVWWNATDYASPEDDPFVEIVSVTARSGDTLTVIRAQEGTSAVNHNTGAKTYVMIETLTAGMWDQIRTDIAAAAGIVATTAQVLRGSGTPEGNVTAPVGTIFLRNDGLENTIVYAKYTGTGNTGWSSLLSVVDFGSIPLIGGTAAGAANFTSALAERFIVPPNIPTYGATITINGNKGWHIITATNATPFTISNPTSAYTGQQLILSVKNASGGALGTITLDTQYKTSVSALQGTNKPANGTRRTIAFRYDGSNWVEEWCSPEVAY